MCEVRLCIRTCNEYVVDMCVGIGQMTKGSVYTAIRRFRNVLFCDRYLVILLDYIDFGEHLHSVEVYYVVLEVWVCVSVLNCHVVDFLCSHHKAAAKLLKLLWRT